MAGTGMVIGGKRQRNGVDEAGLGLIVAGALSKMISSAVTPSADTRQWDNLPNLIGFSAQRAAPGPHHLVVEFLEGAGHLVLARDATFTVTPGAHDIVLFFSDLR